MGLVGGGPCMVGSVSVVSNWNTFEYAKIDQVKYFVEIGDN